MHVYTHMYVYYLYCTICVHMYSMYVCSMNVRCTPVHVKYCPHEKTEIQSLLNISSPLRQAKKDGVRGYSSFTMDDVLVEQCGYYGVLAEGTGVVGRCTNVEVRQCGGSGVVAGSGASITLIGAKMTVHHNCTNGRSDDYGLEVNYSSSSTIQLVFPLTKEQVSLDNGGGGNWGAEYGGDIHQIK